MYLRGPKDNLKLVFLEDSNDAIRACIASKIMLRIALSRLSSFFIIDFSLTVSMRRRVAPSVPAFTVVVGYSDLVDVGEAKLRSPSRQPLLLEIC